MTPEKVDFLKFLGGEEQNLLTSFTNLRREFDLLSHLDGLWQGAADLIDVPEKEQAVPALFLYVHFHLYVSAAALMRGHLSEALASTRKAIDATFAAYEMILDPKQIELYEKRDGHFQFIKTHIAKARKADANRYPLAKALLEQHEVCSQFGSHADVSSFVHRIEMKPTDKPNKSQLFFHYFQIPRDADQYHYYFVELLIAYYHMLQVFRPMVVKLAVGLDEKSWEQGIAALEKALGKEVAAAEAYFAKMQGPNNPEEEVPA
ncbi:hypothetical protein DSM104443_01167 [Usitatibacter rugosus]|uniref:Uncharacterized protein n=1 Tax=Usitatibacter rugosus TaxID=2732067 RepID=A0A6M4GUF8_9PROT|nr:hypothetical protein [Usitatibacter rugosus]QJR10114.1 hypothetical protein DSM104443_01167 [Usitatibacter rugosus]